MPSTIKKDNFMIISGNENLIDSARIRSQSEIVTNAQHIRMNNKSSKNIMKEIKINNRVSDRKSSPKV